MADEQIICDCDVTNGDETVTCSGQSFNTTLDVNDVFKVNADGNPIYKVASITDDENFELTAPYAGGTETVECVIHRSFSTNLHMARPAPGDQGLGDILTDQVIDVIDGVYDGATTTTTGVIELATNAECQTGTDTTRAVTPDGLTAVLKEQNWSQLSGYYIGTDQVRAVNGDGLKLTDDGDNGMFVKDGGYVGVGLTDPSYRLDIDNRSFRVGADHAGTLNNNGRTDTTAKSGYIIIPHYTNAEEPFAAFWASCAVTSNAVYFGGGSSLLNTATQIGFYTAADSTTVTGTERIRITSAGNIGVNEANPVTLMEFTHTAPYITLHNSTEEDGAGGRESRIIARGEQTGGEETVLGYAEFCHDGAADDEKGKFQIKLNDGDDSVSPSIQALTILSTGYVGLFEPAPVSLLEITHTSPYITLHNSAHQDGDGDRKTRVIAKGEQSGGEETTLGYFEFSHDGAADDEKGKLRLLLNDGNDSDTPSISGLTVLSTGYVGLYEQAPVSLLEMTHTNPYITMHNSTHEDGAGGRESRIIARGEQSGGEETVLGYIEFCHDGAADDEKGMFRIDLNDGNDGTSPSIVGISIDSVGILRSLACYSHDMNGETIRDCQINDSGEFGYDSSTKRGKINIEDMEDTSWLYDLRPVNFESRKKDDKGNYTDESLGKKRYGLIAEEVEKVNSSFVFYEEGQVMGVHYKNLIPVLVNEIQRLKTELDVLYDSLNFQRV